MLENTPGDYGDFPLLEKASSIKFNDGRKHEYQTLFKPRGVRGSLWDLKVDQFLVMKVASYCDFKGPSGAGVILLLN